METGNRLKRIIFTTVLIAFGGILSGCAMGSARGSKTNQGNDALETGEYQQAQQLFESAVQEGEEPMLAYRGLGMSYMGLAQYDKAEASFKAALDNSDDHQDENKQDLQLYLATAQYRQGDFEDAITTCDEILENTTEGNSDAYFLRGASGLKDGRLDDAASDFEAAVALSPQNYDLYLNIYGCYDDMNLSGLGAAYLQSALNIQGDDLEHRYNKGKIYYYLENYEEAQRQLIGPVEEKYEPAMYLIGQVYLALGDYDHAESTYEQIESQFGASVQSYNGKALCAISGGNYDEALTCIRDGLALEDGSDKQNLYFNEIVAYERMLDFETAKEKAREYVARYPSDAAGQKEWTFLSTR